MTGTTLTALGEAGAVPRLVVAIEGYPYLLTDAEDTAAAVTAWAGSDWSAALGGLEVQWNLDQRLHPWEPFNSSSSTVTLKIMDVSGTNADVFGLAVFKRNGQTVSPLYADTDVLPGSTTVKVKRSSSFAATGTINVGNEAIGYTANDNGTNPGTFGTLTRGKWSPFKSEGSTRFIRTHRAPATTPTNLTPEVSAGTSALVSDAPLDWRGRWVGIWIHRDMGGTLDVLAQAHLAFAGRIASVSDAADGCTYVHCDEVRQVIGDAVIMREQWSAKIKDGLTLKAGTRFRLNGHRIYESGGVFHTDPFEADELVVVPSGAATVNEINAGRYDGDEIASAINAWAASELAAGNLGFRHTFKYKDTNTAGDTRSSLYFSDDTVTIQATRQATLTCSKPDVQAFFGWSDAGLIAHSAIAYSATAYSEHEPRRAAFDLAGAVTSIPIEQVQGSFASQAGLIGVEPTPDITPVGYVRVGNLWLRCEAPSVTAGEGTILVGYPVNEQIGLALDAGWQRLSSDDDDATLSQVLILESSFTGLVLALLSSMGGGLNWAQYDVLPMHCAANIPYDLMGTGLEADMLAAPGANDVMTIVVDKPTKLVDLLGASFTMRLVQFVWRQGRLALRGYATPTSAATLSIGVDCRATPIDTTDDLLTVTTESDALMRNVLKIVYNGDASGDNFRDTITITDPGSSSNFGAKAITIKARNAVLAAGNAGEDVLDLLPTFLAGLPFLVRPAMVLRVPLDHTMIEQATPGEVVLFTDGFARDPETGVRGLTNKPALVLAQNASWGGFQEPARCEVDLMIFPRLSLAEYAPCAQVDDTAATAGYVAGTKVLTCYAHEHSEASAVADATRFLVGHKVRVIEIDPATAAAPLSWDDTVAAQSGNTITLTTGLAGWDTSKKYRIYSDDYADATTAQRAKAYQADDADGQIADLRAPYSLAFNPTAPTTFTASVATELPERPPTSASGDGAALDTGHARAIARGVNNLISYKTAPQQPSNVSGTEAMSYTAASGTPTWFLVWCEPVHIGVGTTGTVTRKLYVAPTILKSGAASADVRVTLARLLPRSADPSNPSRNDMLRLGPYADHTFTTTSATYETPAEVALAIDHIPLSPGHNGAGGIGWLYVEVANHASFRGMAIRRIGPVVNA